MAPRSGTSVRGARMTSTAMQSATAWEARGWPDFASYAPIFQAAPDAVIYAGQLNGRTAATLVQNGLHAVLPKPLMTAGLAAPLPTTQQHAREDMAICGPLRCAPPGDAADDGRHPAIAGRHADLCSTQSIRETRRACGGDCRQRARATRLGGVPAMLSAVAPDLLVLAVDKAKKDKCRRAGFSTTSQCACAGKNRPLRGLQMILPSSRQINLGVWGRAPRRTACTGRNHNGALCSG